jgi:hypothetical protein
LLANGDRMAQPEFHRRYLACSGEIQAELIGGIVYLASPLSWPHASYHQQLNMVFGMYAACTPGVESGDNATIILGEDSEPQPDLTLRILAACGGQSTVNVEEYVEGPPELLAEIAYSRRAIDMNQKREDYEQAGVQEYLVLCVEEQELHWFRFATGDEIRPNRQRISRSGVFAGLWIDSKALLDQNGPRLIEVVQQGLASRPHAAFVRRLAAARRSQP